jgi:nitroreductase
MEVQEALKKRRSIRQFSSKPIPPDLIEELIDCGRLSPTARNIQPWEFVAVTNKETLNSLGALADNSRFIAESPCCIAVFCKDTKYYLEDGSAATENILIAASALGLAACWVAGDKKPYCDKVRKILKAPEDFKLVSLIPLGYSETQAAEPSKRPLKEVLHWDKFGNR